MKSIFNNLTEFEALRDEEKIDLESADAALDQLCFKRLNKLLSPVAPIRALGIWQWVKELNRVGHRQITVRAIKKDVTPFMQEEGVICFCRKDFYRVDKLFMLFAHESAHFILMNDRNYALIKQLDSEYRAMPDREQKMSSPIERGANLITLRILNRSEIAEKSRKKQKKIKLCIKTLEKQLT